MSSRKEEQRNEKVIRGLMKLPPNRRCINCNSLGPQYVCTNFWTFVCMTCSGIHREFTHRVKSVSMAKFTSQEVEALQNGGNQRAREIYLKHWDFQRQRLPDNSNAEKIREFIRNVYAEKKYVGGGSFDRPPRDVQDVKSHHDETRRASSYHSYSQSPPYDFQYEERRLRRHGPVLTRKPGSDRGLYDGKFSSFLSPSRLSDRSPSRLSDHVYEDRFTIERSTSRVSDYSASSVGDPFRSNIQSPNFQQDIGSPSSETSRDFSSDDIVQCSGNPYPDSYPRKDSGQMLRPQRTASSGSFGSFDSNSFKSTHSVGLMDVGSESEQSVETRYNETSNCPSLSQPSNSWYSGSFPPENVASKASPVHTSHLPGLSSTRTIDIFQLSSASTALTIGTHQSPQPIMSSSLDLFGEMPQQHPDTANGKSPNLVLQNEGWATFDTPQHSVPVGSANAAAIEMASSDNISLGNFNPLLSLVQWPSFEGDSTCGPSSSMPPPWSGGLQNVDLPKTRIEPWKAFEDSNVQLERSTEQAAVHQSSFADQYLPRESEGFDKGGFPNVGMTTLPQIASVSSQISMLPQDSSVFPVMEGRDIHGPGQKSTNPFDLPYDAKIDSENVFWDMSSLQAALPNGKMSTSFTGIANQHWFAQEPPYVPTGSEGFMVGQSPNAQKLNVPSHGPVASVGGNPFA